MPKEIEKVLRDYGLNEKQASVLLACLELGSGSVQQIAQKAGLPRSTVYETLEILREQGFVSTFLKKKIRHFSAEEPERMVRIAEQKAEAIQAALPQLEALVGKNRKRPTVRFYQGNEQMKLIFEEILNEADAFISFGSIDDLFREMGDYWNEFVCRRVKLKIPARVILADSPLARERQRLGPKELRTVKIVIAERAFHGVMLIWKNKISMFSFIEDYVAVVIESLQLADMQRAMFEHLWERTER